MDFLTNVWLRQGKEYYSGLMNGCAPGTHAYLVQKTKEKVPYKSGVLDLGAGSGALLLHFATKDLTTYTRLIWTPINSACVIYPSFGSI